MANKADKQDVSNVVLAVVPEPESALAVAIADTEALASLRAELGTFVQHPTVSDIRSRLAYVDATAGLDALTAAAAGYAFYEIRLRKLYSEPGMYDPAGQKGGKPPKRFSDWAADGAGNSKLSRSRIAQLISAEHDRRVMFNEGENIAVLNDDGTPAIDSETGEPVTLHVDPDEPWALLPSKSVDKADGFDPRSTGGIQAITLATAAKRLYDSFDGAITRYGQASWKPDQNVDDAATLDAIVEALTMTLDQCRDDLIRIGEIADNGTEATPAA